LPDDRLRRWLDIQAIRATLANHSRGIDRCDGSLLHSAYHPDAHVAYGFFDGPAHDFCDLMSATPGGRATMHRTSNVWIKCIGEDRAVSESYAFVYSETDHADGIEQALIGGRYLDRHQRRDGCWRLNHRTYVLEWNVNLPGTGSAQPDFPSTLNRGTKTREDPGAQLLRGWQSDLEGRQIQGEPSMEIPTELLGSVQAALARQDVHDLIMAQARATDRRDEALLASLWHDGATVDIGAVFSGPAAEYCRFILQATAPLKRMYHSIANEWSRVTGDVAVAESYVIAFTTAGEGADAVDELNGGRYLDRFECRGGCWKFTHRTFVTDWVMRQPTTDQSDDPQRMYASLRTRGAAFPDDPVYALWAAEA